MYNVLDTAAHILVFNGFEPQYIVLLVILVLLLCVSALVSGSETAFFSLTPAHISSIRKQSSRADQAILKLLSMQDYLLATVLIANNLVNICIVLLSSYILSGGVTFGGAPVWEFLIKTVVVTFLLLLFGEIMPKIFAAYNSLRFARMISVPLLGLKHLFKPFSCILIRAGSLVSESMARKRADISMDELSNAIEITGNQTDEEKQMLSGIVSFVNTEVEEIMRPRVDVVALDETADYEEVKRTIISSGFSRIPVYRENLDHILGVLYVKDMIPYIGRDAGFEWQKFLRTPYFVPEHKKINDLLEEFQADKVHMAIVVDEYGSTVGLVSLEDILEEIVGEISDESDNEESFYRKIDDHTYLFEGKTHLNDFERVAGLEEDYFRDVRGGAESVAGLMLEIKGDFLKKGESVGSHGILFTAESLDGRRIDKVKVVLPG